MCFDVWSVEDFTILLDLPLYMQKKLYGVYKQGMGHYIQSGMWYVYPKNRTKRNDDKVRFTNIYISPKDFLKYAESTWQKKVMIYSLLLL